MRYFNEHRRKLIKQNYIKGAKATAQGVQKLELENTVNLPPCKLEICGNATQKTCMGKNLFDKQDALNEENWYYSGGSFSYPLNLEVGEKYTLSVNIVSNPSNDAFVLKRKENIASYPSDTVYDMRAIKKHTYTFTADGSECIWIYRNGAISGIRQEIVNEWLKENSKELQIEQGNIATDYEIYVGGKPSPNSDYPQHIDSVDNLELTVEGANLFNEELLLTNKAVTKTDDGYSFNEYMISWSLYANPKDPYITHIKSVVKPNTDYTIAYEALSVGTGSAGSIRINDVNNNIIVGTAIGKGKKAVTFNLTEEQIDRIYRIYMYGTAIMKDFQLLEGAYTVDTLPPYEPYNENPVTISADGIELLGIDEYCDSLEIDFANKKAFKKERVLYKSVGELIDAYGAEYDGIGAICINNDQPRMEIYERNIPYYCTHFISYHNDPHMDESNPRFEVTASGQIWFYYPPLRSVEEFKAWCYENDVKIAYVLENEHQIDITNTEAGQNLLNLTLPEGKSVIFEVSADLAPSNVSLEYYSKTKEDKHKITVNYEDISGMQIKNSDEHFVRRDSLCKIISPNIDGYEPRNESTIVCAKSDTEITLIYNKK